MAISKRKMEANRRNARNSTGPRTEAGKKKSRWNALKHGLTAKRTLLPGLESAKAYRELLEGYRRVFKPKGVLEESLVQELAACYQKKQRGFRVERNEFREAAHAAKEEFLEEKEEHLNGELMASIAGTPLWKRYRRKRDWLVLPESETMETLGRYQRANSRDFREVLATLNKAQRHRRKQRCPRKTPERRAADAT